MKSTIGRYLFTVLFLACLVFPIIDKRFSISTPLMYYTENRPMASKPTLAIDSLNSFPCEFEKYYNDSFRLRSQLIKIYNKLCIHILSRSPIPHKVLVGKNGWLYLSEKDIDIYKGNNLFSISELKQISDEFIFRQKYLEKRGCKLYVAFVPSKMRVYSEYMPDNVVRLDTLASSEQLIQHLKANTSIQVIDLFPVLTEKKKEKRVYFKTDNHWNEIGAYYSGQTILHEMRKDFPNLPGLSLDEIKIDSIETKWGGHMAGMLAIAEETKEIEHIVTPLSGWKATDGKKHFYKKLPHYNFPQEYETVKVRSDSTLPTLLVIRDSFGQSLIPSFSESFSKSVYIMDNWEYNLNEDIVNTEKPDIMLFLIYEPLAIHLKWGKSRFTAKY